MLDSSFPPALWKIQKHLKYELCNFIARVFGEINISVIADADTLRAARGRIFLYDAGRRDRRYFVNTVFKKPDVPVDSRDQRERTGAAGYRREFGNDAGANH